MVRYIIVLVIIIVEIYFFQAVKILLVRHKWLYAACFIPTVFLLLALLYRELFFEYKYIVGVIFSLLIAKLFTIPFLFGEDIVRLFSALMGKIIKQEVFYLPSRRKFVSQIALGVASIPFSALVYGMAKGKYNFKVFKYSLSFDDLPEAFDGFRITQISDIHCGSFDNSKMVKYAVDLINRQGADVIFFTGDLVNNRAIEVEPWRATFSKLSADYGVYSILGNHDYGDYYQWMSDTEKQQNFKMLKQTQKELGFDLILNECRFLEKNNQRIAIVGVENWGVRGFRKDGDLDKVLIGTSKKDFKILLSHDPSHWEKVVQSHKEHIHLTLSGHTHGMQFGIEIPGVVKWSPSQWLYKYWSGMYQEGEQYINVNRGLGFLGFPGRFGIWPEISVITLKKKRPLNHLK